MAETEQVSGAGETESQASPDTGSNPVTTATGTAGDGATFAQADVDRIVTERLERERRRLGDKHAKELAKYEDYGELQEAAARLQEIDDANKSETEKVLERVQELERQAAELQSQNARLVEEQSETQLQLRITAKASEMDFADPLDAYRLLNVSSLTIGDDGEIEGLADQLTALSEAKPYLLRQAPQRTGVSPTNPARGQAPGETVEDKRRRLFGGGDTPFGRGTGGGLILPPSKGTLGETG